MDYALISGVVRNLHIAKGYEDLYFTDHDKNLIGMASIAAAAIGNGTSSTIFASSNGGAEVDMEYFTCFVEKIPVTGRFHKVGFKDGETIDFAVTMNDGLGEAHGARNPIQRIIWTLPYRTRGHVAQKRHDISSSISISFISAALFAIFSFYAESGTLAECWQSVLKFSSISFAIVLTVCFLSRRPFYNFSFEATKIFDTLGFSHPSNVDLPKYHSQADKEYYQEIGKPRPWEDVPWRYRYRSVACSSSLPHLRDTSQENNN
jgi:hypothetical protein